jgi:hypothetical protein
LSVKDEFAGRAVKCPKCGGVIPASKSAPDAPSAAPAPSAAAAPAPQANPALPKAVPVKSASEPEPARDEDRDQPDKGKSGKITGKPVSRSKDAEDDDDRPRKKDRDREDEDDRPRKKGRDRDEDEAGARGKKRDREDDDRPRRRRDDYDDRPRGRSRQAGGGGATVVLILCGTMLLICGGAGYGVYWVFIKAKQGLETIREAAENTNLRVSRGNYDQLAVGTTTRIRAEQILGGGKPVETEDVERIVGLNDADGMDRWLAMALKKRAVYWRNGDDYILAAFHPNADGSARLMLKEWRPKVGASDFTGELLDSPFLNKYPAGKNPEGPVNPPDGPKDGPKDDEPPPGQLTEVAAEELAKEFKDNEVEANGKYKDKWLLVEGKVLDVSSGVPGENPNSDPVVVKLVGVKFPGTGSDFAVWCSVRPEEARNGWDLARGQTIKLKGKCTGAESKTFVNLTNCRIDFKGPDPAVRATATRMLSDYAKTPDPANQKYRGKEVLILDARFESATGDLATFTGLAKGVAIKIQVNLTFGQRKKLAQLTPGAPVKFRAECGGLFGDHIALYRGYFVP